MVFKTRNNTGVTVRLNLKNVTRLDQITSNHRKFDSSIYVSALGISCENMCRWYKSTHTAHFFEAVSLKAGIGVCSTCWCNVFSFYRFEKKLSKSYWNIIPCLSSSLSVFIFNECTEYHGKSITFKTNTFLINFHISLKNHSNLLTVH